MLSKCWQMENPPQTRDGRGRDEHKPLSVWKGTWCSYVTTKIVPCGIAGKGYYCKLMASYRTDHVRPHQCVQFTVIETLPGKVFLSPQEWATSFINISLPAYFAWHSCWEMCGIQVLRFRPDNNTPRLADEDCICRNYRIYKAVRDLQART